MSMRSLIICLCIAAAVASPIGSDPDEWVEKKDMMVRAQQVFEDAAKSQIFEQRTIRDVERLKSEMATGQHWSEKGSAREKDLIEVGWGRRRRGGATQKSTATSKTLSMDVDAKSMGAKAGVCVQAQVPRWVPTAMMNKGMNLVWNTKIGKRIATHLSKYDVQTKEFTVEEKACDKGANPKTLFTYSKNLPFIGTISFTIHGSAGFDLSKAELAQTIGGTDDLVQAGWGSMKKNTERSMDLDVYPAGGLPKEIAEAMKQSMCFQGTIPSWIPTSMLAAGMKLILQDKILKELEKKGMKVEPDKDTEFVAKGGCDRKENPASLLTYTKDLPFVGKLSFNVFSSEALKQMKGLFGKRR